MSKTDRPAEDDGRWTKEQLWEMQRLRGIVERLRAGVLVSVPAEDVDAVQALLAPAMANVTEGYPWCDMWLDLDATDVVRHPTQRLQDYVSRMWDKG